MDCCVVFLGDPTLQYVQLSLWRAHAFSAAARIAVGDVITATRHVCRHKGKKQQFKLATVC